MTRVIVSGCITSTEVGQACGVLTVRLNRVRKIMNRAMEALRHIAKGRTIDEAADDMHLSRSSVEKYLRVVRLSLNARTIAHAVYLATRNGFIMLLITVVLTTPAGRIGVRTMRMQRRNESTELTT